MRRKTKNTHFTLETRKLIEEGLNSNYSVTEIAKLLHRDRSNISREISKHTKIHTPLTFGKANRCNNCKKRKECLRSTSLECEDFENDLCEKLKSSPHVCNGCETKSGCRKAKQYYKAMEANLQYEEKLHSTRKTLHYTELELNILNNDFYCLVKNTGSIYHSLIVINGMGFTFKKSSIYRQIKKGRLRLKSSDLPRVSKRVKKESKDKSYKRDIEGHTYEDYIDYKNSNQKAIEWQMDCVQGIIGKDEPVLLTLQIVEIKFLFAFIMTKQTANKVKETLEYFKNEITPVIFDKIVNILLTDNGHEFIKLEDLQEICTSTNIYYCHPYSSYEKGSIENNHEQIRKVIPQGVSLKPYSQNDINNVISNANSLLREKLDGKCPFDLVNNYIPIETLNKLGIHKIPVKDVQLNPYLLGEKNIKNISKYLSEDEIKKAHIL